MEGEGSDQMLCDQLVLSGTRRTGTRARCIMKAAVILIIVSALFCACSSGGGVQVHYVPSPSPHKVVMTR